MNFAPLDAMIGQLALDRSADLALTRKLDELHLELPSWTRMLRMGIEGLTPQPGTCKAASGTKGCLYLLRKLAVNRANHVWALDTTCNPMACGFVYLTALVVVASRYVLAHKVAITLDAVHAKEVIEQAFARYGMHELVNTDQSRPPQLCVRHRRHTPPWRTLHLAKKSARSPLINRGMLFNKGPLLSSPY